MFPPDETEVLFANDAFYAAFGRGDFAAMDDVWARALPVSCIHPGGPLMLSRTVILESWRAILESGETATVTHLDATPMVVGEVAWVTCLERIGDNVLAATNIFARENDAWKMTHHQAGPTQAMPKPQTPRPALAN
jgi:hypothetical protein